MVYTGDAARGLTLLKATLAHFPEATLTAGGPLRLELIFRTMLGFKDEVVFVLEPAGQKFSFALARSWAAMTLAKTARAWWPS